MARLIREGTLFAHGVPLNQYHFFLTERERGATDFPNTS